MLQMIRPVLLIAFANCFYHIISKSIPSQSNAFLSLVLCYLAASAASFLFFLLDRNKSSIPEEISKLHPSAALLGIVVVFMELGNIFLYRAGWKISQGSLVAHTLGSLILLFVGLLLYRESVSIRQLGGVLFCLIGLAMITL